MTKNPFQYTNVIIDEISFCNRKKEQEELLNFAQNSQNVLIYSQRRLGKTSLIKKVFQNIENSKGIDISTVYIDLFGTTTTKEFLSELVKGFNSIEKKIDKLFKLIKEKISSIKINLTIDPTTGEPSISPEFEVQEKEILIEEVFGLYDFYSQKKRIVIAIDEFQEITYYGEKKFEKLLRKLIQGHQNICYIFAGSQKHILDEMFNSETRALYKLASSFPLKKIDTVHYVDWIYNLFKNAEKPIDKQFIRECVEKCENHPMYIQQFFYYFWENSTNDTKTILKTIIKKHESEYITLWDTLSLNQKKVLKLVCHCNGKNIYSAINLCKYGFRTGSQVLKATSFLVNKGILIKNGNYQFQDIFFKNWIRNFISHTPS